MGIVSICLSAMIGGCIGVVVTSLVVIAKRADEEAYRYIEKSRKIPDLEDKEISTRVICFTDEQGVALFSIPNGKFVILTMGNGESKACICRYLDSDHAEIDGIVWKMEEFMAQMRKRGIVVTPLIEKV